MFISLALGKSNASFMTHLVTQSQFILWSVLDDKMKDFIFNTYYSIILQQPTMHRAGTWHPYQQSRHVLVITINTPFSIVEIWIGIGTSTIIQGCIFITVVVAPIILEIT